MAFSNTTLVYNDTTSYQEYYGFYICMQRLTGLILFPIFCIIGLSANAIGIMVLSRKQMRSSTSSFLIALTCIDTIKICNDSLYFVTVLIKEVSQEDMPFNIVYPYAHYVFNASMTCCSWITVALAIERYIFVCHGTMAKRVCTVKRAAIASFVVVLTSFAITIPYAFRYKGFHYGIEVSTLWSEGLFGKIFNWSHYTIRCIIPIFLLCLFTILILCGLRNCRLRYGKCRLCICILAVITMFVVCLLPDAIISTIVNEGYYEASYMTKGIREITDFLLLIHTLLNFIIYCIFNKLFLKNMKELFKCSATSTVSDQTNYELERIHKNSWDPLLKNNGLI